MRKVELSDCFPSLLGCCPSADLRERVQQACRTENHENQRTIRGGPPGTVTAAGAEEWEAGAPVLSVGSRRSTINAVSRPAAECVAR